MNPLTKKRHCVVYAKPSNARMNLVRIILMHVKYSVIRFEKKIGKLIVV